MCFVYDGRKEKKRNEKKEEKVKLNDVWFNSQTGNVSCCEQYFLSI